MYWWNYVIIWRDSNSWFIGNRVFWWRILSSRWPCPRPCRWCFCARRSSRSRRWSALFSLPSTPLDGRHRCRFASEITGIISWFRVMRGVIVLKQCCVIFVREAPRFSVEKKLFYLIGFDFYISSTMMLSFPLSGGKYKRSWVPAFIWTFKKGVGE